MSGCGFVASRATLAAFTAVIASDATFTAPNEAFHAAISRTLNTILGVVFAGLFEPVAAGETAEVQADLARQFANVARRVFDRARDRLNAVG